MQWFSVRTMMIGATIIVFLILLSLGQELNRRWQYQREVDRLEAEVRDMKKSVIELENLNQYFRTPEYQERLAREKLNYHKPGEKVVLVPQNQSIDTTAENSAAVELLAVSIPQLWWERFFVEN